MKNNYKINALLFIFLISNIIVSAQKTNIKIAQSFHKGSLLIGVSEGNTISVFTTKNNLPNSETTSLVKRGEINGCRDPLFIEYGISNHWGLGLSSGTDIYTLNPNDYYGFQLTDNQPIKVTTNDVTFCGSYHFFSNKRLDLSVFTDVGVFSVNFKGQDGDANPYQYQANGNIIRAGSRVRYYFFRHFGAFGMLSSYAAHTSPKDIKDNTVAQTYSTNVSGCAVEIGLCYRFFK